jgi:hypothetical protein
MDVTDAGRLGQFVGPYSRVGWAHPGPAWFFLLLPVFTVLGSSGAALVASSLLVHGLFAVLVVASAGRTQPWARPLATGVLLLYVLRMPDLHFALVWNPYALLLPTALFQALAARTAAGSVPAAAGAALVGSYLVQTHVGTAPLVGLVGAGALAALGAAAGRGRIHRPGRRGWALAGTALGATLLVWLPPLLQQWGAAPGEGNLAMLAAYFTAGAPEGVPSYSWPQALSAFGQMVGMPVAGWQSTPGDIDTDILSGGVLVAAVAQPAGALALLVLGARLGAGRSVALGGVLLAGSAAGVVACHSVTGAMSNYLVAWITVLPAVLVLGWLDLATRRLIRGRPVGAVVLAALSALTTAALFDSTDALPDQPGVDAASRLVLRALPPPSAGDPPVLVDIATAELWPLATGLALEIEQAGHRVSVEEDWVRLFGRDRESSGAEEWRVSVVVDRPAPDMPDGRVLGTVPTDLDEEAAIVLARVGD